MFLGSVPGGRTVEGVKIPDSSGSVKGAASELVRRLRAGRAGRQSGYIDGKELLAAGI